MTAPVNIAEMFMKDKCGGFLDAHCWKHESSDDVPGAEPSYSPSADLCEQSSFEPTYQECTIFARNRCQLTREIIEAEIIDSLGDNCLSKPSINLSSKELRY